MTAIIMWVGGLLCAAGGTAVAVWGVKLALRERFADAWDYGYNARGYDTITGVVSPNPFTNGQYPVVDPCTLTEPCHVHGCRKHVDGMHVTHTGEAIAHNPFYCHTCKDLEDAAAVVREATNDLLIRTAAALKGDPHPLTMHDHSDLPDVALRAYVGPTCEARAKDRCVITTPHAGKHRDKNGHSWSNMAGFNTPGATEKEGTRA